MTDLSRRRFLKNSGIAALPLFGTGLPLVTGVFNTNEVAGPVIKFYGDGEMFEPAEYLAELQKANALSPIQKDRYGTGGAVEALEHRE